MLPTSKKRTGLFGGTFDPPTFAHLRVAEEAVQALSLDELWFIPTSQNPLKMDREPTPAHLRLAMLKVLLADEPAFRINTCELRQKGVSYTVDTIRHLQSENPDRGFVLIMGMDAYNSLPRWRLSDELAKMAEFAVFNRPGYERQDHRLTSLMNLHFLDNLEIDISSTEVRDRIHARDGFSDLVPEQVVHLIKSHGLYR